MCKHICTLRPPFTFFLYESYFSRSVLVRVPCMSFQSYYKYVPPTVVLEPDYLSSSLWVSIPLCSVSLCQSVCLSLSPLLIHTHLSSPSPCFSQDFASQKKARKERVSELSTLWDTERRGVWQLTDSLLRSICYAANPILHYKQKDAEYLRTAGPATAVF